MLRAEEERKALRAAKRAAAAKTAELPDEKTKVEYEQRIKALQTQVHNLRAKVSRIAKADAAMFESVEDRRFALA